MIEIVKKSIYTKLDVESKILINKGERSEYRTIM